MTTTPKQLAHSVNDRLRLGLTPRPWNSYESNDTLYWLVPSADWPAYHHGKLVFSSAKDDCRKHLAAVEDGRLESETLFAGFCTEKGYGDAATIVNPRLRHTREIMNSDWSWWRVVEPAGATLFQQALTAAAKAAPLSLYVVSSYVHDRESQGLHKWDAVMFQCTANGIVHTLNNRFPVGVLSTVTTATSFCELAEHLRQVDAFHWVDVYAGTHVKRGEADVESLYRNTLSYFDTWL